MIEIRDNFRTRFQAKFQNGVWTVFDRWFFTPVSGPFHTEKEAYDDMQQHGVR